MQRTYPFVAALLVCVLHAHALDADVSDEAKVPSSTVLFDPATVRVPPHSALGRVLAALAASDATSARTLIAERLPAAGEAERGMLLWLAARAAATPMERLSHLGFLAESGHPLAPWARLRWAEGRLATDPAGVVDALSVGFPADWPGAGAVERTLTLALARSDRADEAEPRLRALIEGLPEHVASAALRFALAEILVARGDATSAEEAVRLYQAIVARAPSSADAHRAEAQMEVVMRGMPPERRRALRELSETDVLARGRALMWAREYDAAHALYAALANRVTSEAGERCQALLEAGRALERERKREEAAAWFDKLLARCDDTDVRAWARYYAGRSLYRVGQHGPALEVLQALQEEAPEHRLADDAQYFAAMVAKDLDETDVMVARLQTLVERYPQGDMAVPARFLLAWRARESGDYDKALALLEQAIAEGAVEHDEGCEGRFHYWRARTLGELGRHRDAERAYTRLATWLPLSYYAQQSVARLQESRPALAEEVLVRWRRGFGEEGRGRQDDAPLRLPMRAELQTPAFQRAQAFLRLGEFELADTELRALGDMGEGTADAEWRWMVVSLFDAAGAPAKASRMIRDRLGALHRASQTFAPVGASRSLWRLAYPRAYAPLIEQAATEMAVPAAFVRAVAREESSFDPNAVSSAKAYGLIQLMPATARQHGEQLGLPSSPAALRRPEINLRIGAHFMQFLWRRFEENPALVPAAYNAGHGAAERWLEARGHLSFDAWVETIPYEETRRYTRRVLQSFGIYAWLDGGELPPLSSQLPQRHVRNNTLHAQQAAPVPED